MITCCYSGKESKVRQLLDLAERVKQGSEFSNQQYSAVPGQLQRAARAAFDPPKSVRVRDLATELGVTSDQIVERCRQEGIDLQRNVFQALEPEEVTIVRWLFSEASKNPPPADKDSE